MKSKAGLVRLLGVVLFRLLRVVLILAGVLSVFKSHSVRATRGGTGGVQLATTVFVCRGVKASSSGARQKFLATAPSRSDRFGMFSVGQTNGLHSACTECKP